MKHEEFEKLKIDLEKLRREFSRAEYEGDLKKQKEIRLVYFRLEKRVKDWRKELEKSA